MRIINLLLFFIVIFLIWSSPSLTAERGRFFYEGDGTLAFQHSNSGRKATIRYRQTNGPYIKKAFSQIDWLFGMPSAQLGEGFSLRLIAMLDYLEDKYAKGKNLKIKSGYRSPKYNEGLRKQGRLAAQTSYHTYGMAADVIFPGANHQKIWEYVRSLDCCGIGIYSGNNVHVDSGKPRFWTSETALPKKKEPQENKNIYIAPEFDFYKQGETIRLFFSGISEYPFGVKPVFKLVNGAKTLKAFKPDIRYKSDQSKANCVLLEKKKEARFIYWKIPNKLKVPKSKLGIEVEFCGPKYGKMPAKIVSKPFVVR